MIVSGAWTTALNFLFNNYACGTAIDELVLSHLLHSPPRDPCTRKWRAGRIKVSASSSALLFHVAFRDSAAMEFASLHGPLRSQLSCSPNMLTVSRTGKSHWSAHHSVDQRKPATFLQQDPAVLVTTPSPAVSKATGTLLATLVCVWRAAYISCAMTSTRGGNAPTASIAPSEN